MTIEFSCPDVSDHPDFKNHETVLRAEDKDSGFKAYIAVHSTALGPARGGCRYWPSYRDESEAIKDVLRLSYGMTYKSTLAGLPFGGGKTVIIGKPGTTNPDRETMHALGHMLNELNGIYETGEDVGTRTSDFKIAGEVTEHVRVRAVERANSKDLPGGPPLYTAYGIFYGIKAAVKHQLNKDSVEGVRIAVKGLGNVAWPLCEFLHEEGAILTVADIDKTKVKRAEDELSAKSVSPEQIIFEDVDVYTPCALGGDINDETVNRIKAKIVAGAANNQLASPEHAQMLHERGILYAPDYAINAGGVMNVVLIGLNHEQMLARVADIGRTLGDIFARSKAEDKNTSEIANMIVDERLASARQSDDKIASNGA